MIDCVLKGDAGCGRFLGTLTAASEKNRHKFCEANYYFDKTYSEYMSARPATRKHSALRQLIEEVIGRANLGRSYFVDTGERLGLVADIAVDDLRSLPEFGQNQIEKFEIGRALASSDQ